MIPCMRQITDKYSRMPTRRIHVTCICFRFKCIFRLNIHTSDDGRTAEVGRRRQQVSINTFTQPDTHHRASKCMNAMQLWRSETTPLIVLLVRSFLSCRTVLYSKYPLTHGEKVKERMLYISANSICDCNAQRPHTHTNSQFVCVILWDFLFSSHLKNCTTVELQSKWAIPHVHD